MCDEGPRDIAGPAARRERTYLAFERWWFHTSPSTRHALDRAMGRYGGHWKLIHYDE